MRETLLFANSQDMAAVLEKIRVAFPKVVLQPISRDDCEFFPVGIDLGLVEEHDFAEWAIENDVLPFCANLALKSCDPTCEWMQLLLEADRLKKEAKKLDKPE